MAAQRAAQRVPAWPVSVVPALDRIVQPPRGMTLWRDVRHSARLSFRHRGTALLVTVCLSLGIGIVTTMFASADPWLFRPLPQG